MKKIINVNGKDIEFKASGATVRIYREKFNRDLFKDIQDLQPRAIEGVFTGEDLEVFENIAYTMAYQANHDIGSIEEWLEQFEMLSIYQVLPELIELWQLNTLQLSEPKKKVEEQSDN